MKHKILITGATGELGSKGIIIEMLITFGLAIARGEFDQQSNDLEMV